MFSAGKICVVVVILLKITSQTRQAASESFDEGLIGCMFDGDLCEQHERCLDDNIFGRCVPLPNNYGRSIVRGRKERMILVDEDLAALEKTFTFLKNSGAHWRSKETQCVLRYILNYFHSGEFSIPDVCDKLENVVLAIGETSEDDPELYGKAGKPAKISPTYIGDAIRDSLRSVPEALTADDFQSENHDLTYLLPQDIENNDSSVTLISPIEQLDSILFANEDNLKGILLKRKEDGLDSIESPDDAAVRSNIDNRGFRFKRQERLDVKKPGPWFAVNNFAFADSFDTYDEVFGNPPERLEAPQRKEIFMTNNYRPAIPAIVAWKKVSHMKNRAPEKDSDASNHAPSLPESIFQSTLTELPTDQRGHDKLRGSGMESKMGNQEASHPRNEKEVVEASYVFITVKDGFETWKEGAHLVSVLAQILKVPPETFNDVGVSGNQVSFRIMPNNQGVDPFKIVEKTDELRSSIRQLSSLEIDSIGIGDEAKISSVLYRHNSNRQLFNVLVVCFASTAGLAMVIILWLVRRRWLLRKKLKDVASVSSQEISRDYQDLCRARMASKTFDGSKDIPRISQPHLSRESESSRSSTSSWCEEPVLTNMDISTGHMVLSYMEDHLRNRDRLDREWMALCAYEAEPCVSTETASKAEFKEKNRYDDVLPYDHSRVILNSVANTGGFDYINASLIADHDPRHPAYIAAQAPVAESVADFWQMIWEQGTVVLVLLTRLTENGKEQCHLYWPTEGSQLYHIYEVHLVSEHIWCDDYLVRSFYLKNIRTGETRTVTQFHFLSWAENAVPASTRALLEFRRKINKSYRGRSSPILIHCSDGAGRTGTYCLIDMVLHRMAKGAREIDIAATLEHVRDQRMKAVRTKQQFEFVLTAVAEEVHAILRALPQ